MSVKLVTWVVWIAKIYKISKGKLNNFVIFSDDEIKDFVRRSPNWQKCILCDKGHFNLSDMKCKICPDHCLECNDTCTLCEDGYSLENGDCLENKQEGCVIKDGINSCLNIID